MKESTLIKTVNYLLAWASICLFYGITYTITEEHDFRTGKEMTKFEHFQTIPTKEEHRQKRNLPFLIETADEFDRMYFSYRTMEFDYIGMCFITAYCPWECGYNGSNFPNGWKTASGTICHYEDKWNVPTTCAIDRRYFDFGDEIAVGDGEDRKVYVCEDTGAFSGMWVDCFVLTMYEVETWDTGFRPVYAVRYEEVTYSKTRKEITNERFKHYLFYWCVCNRSVVRNDS